MPLDVAVKPYDEPVEPGDDTVVPAVVVSDQFDDRHDYTDEGGGYREGAGYDGDPLGLGEGEHDAAHRNLPPFTRASRPQVRSSTMPVAGAAKNDCSSLIFHSVCGPNTPSAGI